MKPAVQAGVFLGVSLGLLASLGLGFEVEGLGFRIRVALRCGIQLNA